MRRKLVLGVGLAGVLSGPAAAQFAADAKPFGGAAPTPPAARPANPAAPPKAGAYVPPVGGLGAPATPAPATGFRPAGSPTAAPTPAVPVDLPSALGADHPLRLRPEHGHYFVLVKSYSRPARPTDTDPGLGARELAEGLAAAVRQVDRTVPVYLYEHVSDEMRASAAAAAAARQRANAFLASVEEYRKQSLEKGLEFIEPEMKVRYNTVNYRHQVGVLVGGYATEDEAVRALAVVKRWPAPADVRLLDGAAMVRPVDPDKPDGRTTIERTFLNPYPQAMVVPNPLSPRPKAQAAAGLDPFVVKLNQDNPYSLLKAKKTWTLGVKSFAAPVTYSSPGDSPGVVSKKTGKGYGGEALTAGAGQAEKLAEAIRQMTASEREGYRPLNLEAFVLHTRYASLVTVGQFDSPDDPALIETRRLLQGIAFQTQDKNRMPVAPGSMLSVFGENILPVPIPKP